MNTGKIIRNLRVEKGYTQQFVADQLKISRNAYMSWENNRVELTFKRLISLCSIYKIGLEDFFRTDNVLPPPVAGTYWLDTFRTDHIIDKLNVLKAQNNRLIRMNNRIIRMIRLLEKQESETPDLQMQN